MHIHGPRSGPNHVSSTRGTCMLAHAWAWAKPVGALPRTRGHTAPCIEYRGCIVACMLGHGCARRCKVPGPSSMCIHASMMAAWCGVWCVVCGAGSEDATTHARTHTRVHTLTHIEHTRTLNSVVAESGGTYSLPASIVVQAAPMLAWCVQHHERRRVHQDKRIKERRGVQSTRAAMWARAVHVDGAHDALCCLKPPVAEALRACIYKC